jgi:hypothetical protein
MPGCSTHVISYCATSRPPWQALQISQPETPGMTGRVDCVDLLTQTYVHTGDTRAVWASWLSGTVSSGL